MTKEATARLIAESALFTITRMAEALEDNEGAMMTAYCLIESDPDKAKDLLRQSVTASHMVAEEALSILQMATNAIS